MRAPRRVIDLKAAASSFAIRQTFPIDRQMALSAQLLARTSHRFCHSL